MTTSHLEVILGDLRATEKLGSALAFAVTNGGVILLEGPLGSGKTTLVQAICRQLGVTDSVTSPTYDLLHSYYLPHLTVHHVDGYRLLDPREWDVLDLPAPPTFKEVILAEWGAVLQEQYPDRLDIQLICEGATEVRHAQLRAIGPEWMRKLDAIAEGWRHGV